MAEPESTMSVWARMPMDTPAATRLRASPGLETLGDGGHHVRVWFSIALRQRSLTTVRTKCPSSPPWFQFDQFKNVFRLRCTRIQGLGPNDGHFVDTARVNRVSIVRVNIRLRYVCPTVIGHPLERAPNSHHRIEPLCLREPIGSRLWLSSAPPG